ncbi:hypothetical protein CcI6DRAFT_00447, partial [Frankia sp. CcI6]
MVGGRGRGPPRSDGQADLYPSRAYRRMPSLRTRAA